mmetsp:Transcript_41430/g.118501  ORF Transcript_41430/g.118501 Transcript_41430/m.118501 type:complete len:223 (+) Transcript_41430:59-727(+)
MDTTQAPPMQTVHEQAPQLLSQGGSTLEVVRGVVAPAEAETVQQRVQKALATAFRTMQAWCSELATMSQQRCGTAMAGRSLLAGGAEEIVLAKKASLDATIQDARLVSGAQAEVTALKSAAEKLRVQAAATSGSSAGVSGQGDFAQLADLLDSRAKVYQQVADLLQEPAVAPTLSPAEMDALRMIAAKQQCSIFLAEAQVGCGTAATETVRTSRRAYAAACA